MNTAPIVQRIGTRPVEGNGILTFLQRETQPALLALLRFAGRVGSNTSTSTTADITTDPQADLVLVSAASGNRSIAVPTVYSWVKRQVIQKVDASTNTVTVAGLASGSVVLTAQWQSVEVMCDGVAYYPVVSSATIGPATQTQAGTQSATDKKKEDQTEFISASVTYPTSAGSSSVTVLTIPASPSGADRFVLEEFDVRTTGIDPADTGTVTHTVGLTAGGLQFMTAQNVTNVTAAGLIGGLQLPTLGASHTAAQGYEARMDAGQAIVLQVTTAGGTVTAGKSATIYVKGRYLQ